MVEKDKLLLEKLKYAGLGDLKATYKFARDWFVEEGFGVIEESYAEKISGSGSKEFEIKWVAGKKITDYFRITIRLKWIVIGVSDVEVEIDGRKKKMNKIADLTMEIQGVLEKDYSGKWEGTGMQKFFQELYHKYIIPQRTDEKEEQTVETVQNFKEEMKAFLELTGRK